LITNLDESNSYLRLLASASTGSADSFCFRPQILAKYGTEEEIVERLQQAGAQRKHALVAQAQAVSLIRPPQPAMMSMGGS